MTREVALGRPGGDPGAGGTGAGGQELRRRPPVGQLVLADAYIKWYRPQEYYDGWHGTWAEALTIGLPAALVPTALMVFMPASRITRLANAAAFMIFSGDPVDEPASAPAVQHEEAAPEAAAPPKVRAARADRARP